MARKRGKQSLASLMTPNVRGLPARIAAPSNMKGAALVLWREIVDACSEDHFRPSDMPLLQSYVAATLTARANANNPKSDPDKFAIFEKAARLQKSLATSLRLAPSTRSDPKTIARQQISRPQRPWEKMLEDDDEPPFSRSELGEDFDA